ncbi:O-antigen ligase family protein [Zunongwangia sp. F260]|uniref:O-antigen ligase family protein n=1 Tax=Autumnicola lenta TaxID=3075593 RepID=A0ABU3CMH9_9FLAO|nr:O-antigen ligase family protein [Zunongwangia sp. F260]MDT0647442.1 O-antigen ligase family protein [Zunongwangia sp. F260]
MYNFLNPILSYRYFWISVFLIFGVGLVTNFLISGVVLIIFLLSFNAQLKTEYLLFTLLGTFILASNISPNFQFAQNLRFVGLAASLVYLFYNRGIVRSPANNILPFAIYAFIITLIYSPIGFEAVLRGVSYWLVALVIFTAYQRSYLKDAEQTSRLLLGFFILYFFLNALLIFYGSDLYLMGRFRGIMGNPNELGLVCVFGFGIIDLLFKRQEISFNPKHYLILKCVIVGLIVLTGSRTSLFAIVIYFVTQRLFRNKLLLVFALIFLGILYYLSLSVDPEALVKSLGLSQELRVESLTTGSGRTEVWEVAWEEIKEKPWIGRGMQYDSYFINEYVENNFTGVVARHWAGIWNSYLSLLLDVGIIGLLAYFFFIIRMFRISHFKNTAAAFLAMTLFAGITESWMAASMNAFTPMFFLYWAIQSQPVSNTEEIIEG